MGNAARLIEEVVVIEPTRRVRKRRTVPALPEVFGEKPVYWWSLNVPTEGEWHFVFISSDTLRLLAKDKVFGLTVYDQRTVYIAKELLDPGCEGRLRGTFLHEICHVIPFGLNYVATINRLLGGRTAKLRMAREENWCEHLSGTLDVLFDVGVLRLPPLPRTRRTS